MVDSVNLKSVHWASVDDSSRGALPDRSLNGGNLGSTGASRLSDPLQYFFLLSTNPVPCAGLGSGDTEN